MPAVSVITPAFWAEAFIARAVRSVMAQTFTDWEMIIVSDDGQDYLRLLDAQQLRDNRIRCVSTGTIGSGPSRARNVGVETAKSHLIALLDADDTFAANRLEIMLPTVQQHGAALSAIRLIDDQSGGALPVLDQKPAGIFVSMEELPLVNLHANSHFVFDRRKVPARWWEEITHLEDMVFILSCFDHVDGIYYVPQPLYHYHVRQGSLCNGENAADAFIRNGNVILAMLETYPERIKNPAVNRLLKKIIPYKNGLEILYKEALAQGQCKDYQQFMRDNLPMFYRIE